MSRASTASSSGEIPALNGIRALAVSLVFLAHSGLEQIVPGGLGVTVFFVLSGYLITTLMQREFIATGGLALPAFYLRRLLRLMPPLLVVVALAALLSALSLVDGEFSLRGLLSVLFYFGNYHVIAADFGGLPDGLGVVWSLAVEEHYYLLYPPLALALLRLGRPRLAAAVLVGLCALILAWRYWLAAQGASAAYIGMATDTRADAILVGCTMAFLFQPSRWPARPGRDSLIAAACLALLLATLLYRDERFRLTLRYTLQSLAVAPLIALVVVHSTRPALRWLGSRPLVYLGGISYTVYLAHQLILHAVQRQVPHWGWAATLLLTALLTWLLAEPVRRWVEQPSARLRRQWSAPSPRSASAVGAQPVATP